MDTPILIYLAGPITGVSREKARGWRRRFADVLLYRLLMEDWTGPAVVIYDPASAFSVSAMNDATWGVAMRVDLEAIRMATIVIAQFLPGIKSRGTDCELAHALALGKRIVAFGPAGTIHTAKTIALQVAMLDLDLEPLITVRYDLRNVIEHTVETLKKLATAEERV